MSAVLTEILIMKAAPIVADIAADALMDFYRKTKDQVVITPAEILKEAEIYQRMKEAGDKKIKDRIAGRTMGGEQPSTMGKD